VLNKILEPKLQLRREQNRSLSATNTEEAAFSPQCRGKNHTLLKEWRELPQTICGRLLI